MKILLSINKKNKNQIQKDLAFRFKRQGLF